MGTVRFQRATDSAVLLDIHQQYRDIVLPRLVLGQRSSNKTPGGRLWLVIEFRTHLRW